MEEREGRRQLQHKKPRKLVGEETIGFQEWGRVGAAGRRREMTCKKKAARKKREEIKKQ